MRNLLKISASVLLAILGLQICAHIFNFNDTLLLIVSVGTAILLALFILVAVPIALIKKNLRNARTFYAIGFAMLSLALSFYMDIKWGFDYWNIRIENDVKEEVSLKVFHSDGNYDYDLTIDEEDEKHVYVPIRRLKNSKVRVCTSKDMCMPVTMNCRGFGGCVRDSCIKVSAIRKSDGYPHYCGDKW
jgi:hypothetical protein